MKSIKNERKLTNINKKEDSIEDTVFSGAFTKGQYLGLTGYIIVEEDYIEYELKYEWDQIKKLYNIDIVILRDVFTLRTVEHSFNGILNIKFENVGRSKYLKSFSFKSSLPKSIIFRKSNLDHIWDWLVEETDEKINVINDLSYGKLNISNTKERKNVLKIRKTYDLDSNAIILHENINQLNTQYNELGLYFTLNNSIIKISEYTEYLLNNFPEIKDFLVKRLRAKFNNVNKWYIGKNGIRYLRSRRIKFNPSRTKEILISKLINIINQIKEEKLRESIKQFLKKHQEFFEAPAAVIHHHNYKGGLLEHTVQTVEIALAIAILFNLKDRINMDVLIAGAILHDIGKINCYEYNQRNIDITELFLKHEHIIQGVKIVTQYVRSKKIDNILHIIASHHNFKEWGSPIKPNCIEAWIVHYADNISGKIG